MKTQCPYCERTTWWPQRVGNFRTRPKDLPRYIVNAVLADGECCTCYRERRGIKRHSERGVDNTMEPAYKYQMDDAEAERVRNDLERYWERRRQRGIHPNGRPAELLHKGGLTLLEA